MSKKAKKKPNRKINRILLLASVPMAYAGSWKKIYTAIRALIPGK